MEMVTTDLTITLEDVNDNSPVFEPMGEVPIKEDLSDAIGGMMAVLIKERERKRLP